MARKPAKKPAAKPVPKKKLAKKPAPVAKRPPKPKQNNWLTPYLTVADAKASIEFYGKAFGFQPALQIPGPGGAPMHAEMTYKGATVIMFAPEGAMGSPTKTPGHTGVPEGVGLYVYCDDVDALAQRARAAGATTLSEPETMFWGDRVAHLQDPDGHRWTFATNVADFDASKMPE